MKGYLLQLVGQTAPRHGRNAVREAARVAAVSWKTVASDIERFVEDRHDALDKHELLTLLEAPRA